MQAKIEQPSGRLSDATVEAINDADPKAFLYAYFSELRQARAKAAQEPGQGVNLDGWLRRLNTRYAQACILNGEPQVAAHWLNGRSSREINLVLTWLTPSEKAELHSAAKQDPGLGAGSNIAKMTAPPPARSSASGRKS